MTDDGATADQDELNRELLRQDAAALDREADIAMFLEGLAVNSGDSVQAARVHAEVDILRAYANLNRIVANGDG